MKKTIVWRYHHFTHAYQKLWSHDVWFLRYGAQQTNGATDKKRDGQKKWHIELAALLENLTYGPINRKTFSRITYVYAIFMLFLYMCEPNLTNIYHTNIFVPQKHKSVLTHVGWYNLYVDLADPLHDIFLICKVRRMETRL